MAWLRLIESAVALWSLEVQTVRVPDAAEHPATVESLLHPRDGDWRAKASRAGCEPHDASSGTGAPLTTLFNSPPRSRPQQGVPGDFLSGLAGLLGSCCHGFPWETKQADFAGTHAPRMRVNASQPAPTPPEARRTGFSETRGRCRCSPVPWWLSSAEDAGDRVQSASAVMRWWFVGRTPPDVADRQPRHPDTVPSGEDPGRLARSRRDHGRLSAQTGSLRQLKELACAVFS